MDLDVGAASGAEVRAVAAEAWGAYQRGVDVVVNNAGFIVSGRIEELMQEGMEASFMTSFHGPLNITRAFLPQSRRSRTETLVYIKKQKRTKRLKRGSFKALPRPLSKELAILAPGLKVKIVEPGYFRTKVNNKIAGVPPRIPDFEGFNGAAKARAEMIQGTEPGDPDKAAKRIAGGREVPLRIIFGSDRWERIRDKCEICQGMRVREDVARSTDL
ncbi:hypothetical protein CORC01_11991 [Colletotrichum orchidophilum]|uniref:Short chain dehydrogenase n=1 Tax=Colletotrichum orchidophilum TaxID=1209926 RepID=A0A1G4AU65_9PEZI|nr:uncharacterized protein CORC01_11991 [Colletotrichum orchidophilum]OHE92710.1 hypothetical protein CORC01_11991 [Colletotrichum orchidophilum]